MKHSKSTISYLFTLIISAAMLSACSQIRHYRINKSINEIRREAKNPHTNTDSLQQQVLYCIQKAVPLDNALLNAELYKLMADITKDNYRYIYYLDKVIATVGEFPLSSANFTMDDYYKFCVALWENKDYREAIKYGKYYLTLHADADKPDKNQLNYIHTMDILGSSYRALNNIDSSLYYYNYILDGAKYILKRTPAEERIPVWEGIAKGNIGLIQTDNEDFDKALPNLQAYSDISAVCKDTVNWITALSGLGYYHYKTGDNSTALSELSKAWNLSETIHSESYSALIAGKLAQVYTSIADNNDTRHGTVASMRDNAAKYENLYLKFNQKLLRNQEEAKADKIRIQVELENAITAAQTKNELSRYSRSKGWLTFGFYFLLLVIVLIVVVHFRYRRLIPHNQIIGRIHVRFRKTVNGINQKLHKTPSQISPAQTVVPAKPNTTDTPKSGTSSEKSAGSRKNQPVDLEKLKQSAIKRTITGEKWFSFKEKLAKAYPAFFDNLEKVLGERSTQSYRKISALILLGMNNSEIGKALLISKESVSRAKRRLKTALGIAGEDQQKLHDFISSIAK